MQFCVSSTNKLWQMWEEKCPLQNIKWNNTDPILVGWSKASLRTNFILKKLKISLDAGLSCPYDMDHIFLTHGHADHSASITFYLLNENVTNIYVPNEITNILREKIKNDYYLTHSKVKDQKRLSHKIIGVNPGNKFNLLIKNSPSVVEIFKCYHSVPTVGFGISKISSRIKEEYKLLSNDEKKKLGINGINMKEEYEEPFILYLGDTDARVFGIDIDIKENNYDSGNIIIGIIFFYLILLIFLLSPTKINKKQDIFKYPIIMVECTFILDEDLEKARIKTHMHWKDLEPVIKSHPNNQFILYHFSRRYTNETIDNFFTKCIKPDNCHIWNSP
jgi:ribonuclease BN (tRNA processing enzyme)